MKSSIFIKKFLSIILSIVLVITSISHLCTQNFFLAVPSYNEMLINLTEIEKIKKHHIREQIQSLFQQKIPKRRELFFHIVELLDLKDKIGAEIGTSVCTFECESLVNAGMKQMTMVDNRKLPKPEDVKDNRIKLMKANARKLPFKKNH